MGENIALEIPADRGIPKLEGDKGGASFTQEYDEKRRGRGRSKGSGAKNGPSAVSDGLQKDSLAGLEELYKAENWEEIAALPFNIRQAMTGSGIFELDRKQKEVLGRTLAASMRLLGVMDPRYVALILFGVNLTTIWAEKEILYALEKKSRADKEAIKA